MTPTPADADRLAFHAEVRAVKTMADGTVNVTLNLPEYHLEEAKRFIDWHHLLVQCVVEVEEDR